MSRSLLRSVLELRTPITRQPPSFLLPRHATRSFSATISRGESAVEASSITEKTTTDSLLAATTSSTIPPVLKATETNTLYPKEEQARKPLSPSASASISQLLPLLKTQPSHYITAHVHGRPYLVTAGDQIRLPFKMPGVLPGDILRLDRASTLGSRDYTLKGSPYIDERLFECRATVLGTESEPMRTMIKTKRRQRRRKTVNSKHKYTILRISELVVKGPEAIGL
jgi:large subunit ribosomal protein L21